MVFNTPGANANGVKELVIAGMLLASRDIVGGINWVREFGQDQNIAKLTEKQKKAYAGSELKGKRLGIIGLGAIGVLVANAAISLGMEVYGYDPYISVDAAGIFPRRYGIYAMWRKSIKTVILSQYTCLYWIARAA